MRILVTGGAGYIGSHACKALSRAGHQPIVYDNLTTGHEDAVKWGPLERGDIRDGARLDEVLRRHRPDMVMHFAALATVADSVADPALYYHANIGGSLSILDAMRRNGVGAIVFSSTCAVYGMPEALPISEAAPRQPINPYGFTKLAIEHALADYGAAYGLTWMALRYFNAAGADPDGELGERHDPETHAIPLAILAALGRGPPFRVFGTDYPTPDGSAIRDYIHVTDLAEAHVRAAEALRDGRGNQALNLGTGQGTSVFEIARAVERATGRPLPIQLAPRRAGDPPVLYAKADAAQAALGWTPRYTDIDAIVGSAAQWFLRHHNR